MHQATSSASLAPWGKRLEDRVAEQVLNLGVGQVAGDEGLVVLPQAIGDLGDRGLGDQQLPGRISEGVKGAFIPIGA
jgi:hypothetical protein